MIFIILFLFSYFSHEYSSDNEFQPREEKNSNEGTNCCRVISLCAFQKSAQQTTTRQDTERNYVKQQFLSISCVHKRQIVLANTSKRTSSYDRYHHGNIHTESDKERQSSGGLRYGVKIENGVQKPGTSKQPEVPRGNVYIRASEHVQQSKQDKGYHVLQVISMTSGKKNKFIIVLVIVR